MTIFFITTFYYPNEVGGTETQTRAMAEILRYNNDVYVFAFDADKESTSFLHNGVKVTRIYVPILSDYLTKYAAYRKPIPKLALIKLIFSIKVKKYIKQLLHEQFSALDVKPDVVHYSSNFVQFNVNNLLKSIQQIFPRSKKVFSIHDHFLFGRGSSYPHKKRFIWSSYKLMTLRKYKLFFILPSRYLLSIFEKDLKRKKLEYLILPHYVPFNYCSRRIEGNEFKIMFAGSFEFQKGPDILVRVFKKLNDIFPGKLRLILVGEGSFKTECISILNDDEKKQLIEYPKLERKDLFTLMSDVEFVVVPSRYNEIFGLVAAEAIFAGSIPLVSNRGALPEIVEGKSELVFNSEDDLFLKLKEFIQNPEKIATIKNQLHSNIYKYSLDYYQEKLNNYYLI